MYLNITSMDPDEPIDPSVNEPEEEFDEPAQLNADSDDDEDEFPEFGNDENKKLFELVRHFLGRSGKRNGISRK